MVAYKFLPITIFFVFLRENAPIFSPYHNDSLLNIRGYFNHNGLRPNKRLS